MPWFGTPFMTSGQETEQGPYSYSPGAQTGLTCKNSSLECTYHYAQLLYTTWHKTVLLVIFPLILQTIITPRMPSIGDGGAPKPAEPWQDHRWLS